MSTQHLHSFNMASLLFAQQLQCSCGQNSISPPSTEEATEWRGGGRAPSRGHQAEGQEAAAEQLQEGQEEGAPCQAAQTLPEDHQQHQQTT